VGNAATEYQGRSNLKHQTVSAAGKINDGQLARQFPYVPSVVVSDLQREAT